MPLPNSIKCFFGFHRWHYIAADQYTRHRLDSEAVVQFLTRALRSCVRCGKVNSEKLDGTWSLEQLREGEELNTLENMLK